MLVYRLETLGELGVYGRGFSTFCTRSALEPSPETAEDPHPSPAEEEKLKSWWKGEKIPKSRRHAWKEGSEGRRKWLCAFGSLKQLTDWFPPEGLVKMQALNVKHQEDMAVAVYDVPHHKIKRGDFQVLFHRDHKVLVERISLVDLLAML